MSLWWLCTKKICIRDVLHGSSGVFSDATATSTLAVVLITFHLVMDCLFGPLHWKGARMIVYDTLLHKISLISVALSTWAATRANMNKNTIVIGHSQRAFISLCASFFFSYSSVCWITFGRRIRQRARG